MKSILISGFLALTILGPAAWAGQAGGGGGLVGPLGPREIDGMLEAQANQSTEDKRNNDFVRLLKGEYPNSYQNFSRFTYDQTSTSWDTAESDIFSPRCTHYHYYATNQLDKLVCRITQNNCSTYRTASGNYLMPEATDYTLDCARKKI